MMDQASGKLLPFSKQDLLEPAAADVVEKPCHDSLVSAVAEDSPSFPLTAVEYTKTLPLVAALGLGTQLVRYILLSRQDESLGGIQRDTLLPILLGPWITTLSYVSLRLLKCHESSSFIASFLISLESGTLSSSQSTLLDSRIVFLTSTLIISCLPGYTPGPRWVGPALASVSLGAGLCFDWQAILSMLALVIYSHYQLLVEDRGLPIKPRLYSFLSRMSYLLVAPLFIFLSVSCLQYQLYSGIASVSSTDNSTWVDVALGSNVTIRHFNTPNGYLHSHDYFYPNGSKQQQVSLFASGDENMRWQVDRSYRDVYEVFQVPDWQIAVTDRRVIRLQHLPSAKRLHSHQEVLAPVVEDPAQHEMTAYGLVGYAGDANDDWLVEVVYSDLRDEESFYRLRTRRTLFRLRHTITGCYLFSNGVQLPDWGFGQQEVTCHKSPPDALNTLWIIDEASHKQFPAGAELVGSYTSGAIEQLWDARLLMWAVAAGWTNNRIIDFHQNFWVQAHNDEPLPTPLQLSVMAIIAYILLRIYNVFRSRMEHPPSVASGHDTTVYLLFAGWLVHYILFPFVDPPMSPHPRFPALYISILLLAVVFDYATLNVRPRARLQIFILAIALIIGNFVYITSSSLGFGFWGLSLFKLGVA